MIERLRLQIDRQEGRLDDHTRRIGHLEVEESRTRKRLHEVESDRDALGLLVETTKSLAEQTRALAGQASDGMAHAEALAESAAAKAVEKAFARRAASRWRLAGRLASHTVAIASIASIIVYAIFH